jgi:hypothetical protein
VPRSFSACLVLTPCAGPSHCGAADTVWINSCDQAPTALDHCVQAQDLASFAGAYRRCRDQGVENWAWDLVSDSTCTVGQTTLPVFSVGPSDFSAFSAHYTHNLEEDACDSEE